MTVKDKNILIAGYYGHGNLGDELILSAMLKQLSIRFPKAHFRVLSAHPIETSTLHGVWSFSRWNLFSFLRALQKSDLFILGGGGLFQDKTSFRSLLYYLTLLFLARVVNRPIFLYAVGVETLSRNLSRWLTRWILSNPKLKMTVRDTISKDILTRLGLEESSIYVTADPVFSISNTSIPFQEGTRNPLRYLFVPRFPCPKNGWALYNTVLKTIQSEFPGSDGKGLLFQGRTEMPFTRNWRPEIEWLSFQKQEQLQFLYEKVDVVVSARYHGLVLAVLFNKPFVGLGELNKVGRICDVWSAPFLPWDCDVSHIQKTIEDLGSLRPDQRHETLRALWKKYSDLTASLIPE